ncbi:hypothetical protein P692DRAFT_201809446, partial [Suillus brevipes Sb2]
ILKCSGRSRTCVAVKPYADGVVPTPGLDSQSAWAILKFLRELANNGQAILCTAEYMLDVIGAGAIASTSVDWHTIWKNSPEAARLQEEIEEIHNEGLARPVVQAAQPTEFATSCLTSSWPSPSRFAPGYPEQTLCDLLGLSDLCPSQQLQTMFIDIRSVYEIRECPSRMYNWTALIVSEILVELSWNIMCSSLFFVCWYWTVGFPKQELKLLQQMIV